MIKDASDNWANGIDLISIDRFRTYPLEQHHYFYQRLFTPAEIQYCLQYSDPYPHFAGIFCAKEAVFKAVNKFLPVSLLNIEILHQNDKRPIVKLNSSFDNDQNIEKKKNFNQSLEVKVSITHTKGYALAWALVILNSQSSKNSRLSSQKAENILEEVLNNAASLTRGVHVRTE